MAVSNEATFNLFSVRKAQSKGLNITFTSLENKCIISNETSSVEVKADSDGLYYLNVFDLAGDTNTAVAANTIAPESISTESRRIQPSNDISRRVWALHRSLLHISLRRIFPGLTAQHKKWIWLCPIKPALHV
jgi:hypothetical protein